MKKTIKLIVLALVCLPFLGIAQNPELDKYFDKYFGHDDVTTIMISTDAIKFSFADSDDDADQVERLMEQVDKVKIMNFKNRYKTFDGNQFVDEIEDVISEDYKLLLDVIDGTEKIKIYVVNGEKRYISEGLIVVQDKKEAHLIWVTGKIVLSDFMHSHKHFRKYH